MVVKVPWLTSLIIILSQVSAKDKSSRNPYPVIADVTVRSFLDDNYYIRLNISWGEIINSSCLVSIRFRNGFSCNQINEIEEYRMEDNNFIIVPSMEMEHPADYLTHGCEYLITVEDADTDEIYENITYTIPDCVEAKCVCRKMEDSPYKLKTMTEINDGIYLIELDKLAEENLTVHEIYYQKFNNSLRTFIPERNITVTDKGIQVPLVDLNENVPYTITVKFLGLINECVYLSSVDYTDYGHRSSFMVAFIAVMVIIVSIALTVYVVTLRFPKLKNKLRSYVPCLRSMYHSGNPQENICYMQSFSKLRQEINAQYTPLEFVLNVHNFDEYEVPRNKIIFKEELDSGAFGTVYLGKVFDLGEKPTFTMVAIKKLREGPSAEEVEDFRNEIEILKKIGVHENIVHLLGCVTMDEPYMMIMELVPCGSLKKYLLMLRQKWKKRKQEVQNVFFPDDMSEDWMLNGDEKNSDGEYILPDDVFNEPSSPNKLKSPRTAKRKSPGNLALPQRSPVTPLSLTSSRLPSCTETEITVVNSEPGTPPVQEIKKRPNPVLDHTELQQFAFQIAKGMAHLEKIKIAHRDLAARNVLISKDKTLKISDFGLSRTGPYVSHRSKKLPLRWMAVEAIEERTCDNKSDVWSFGVVLWEIGTLGAFPYEKTPDSLVLHHLKQGRRLDRPEVCTDDLYSVMLKCWEEKPENRPSFQELVECLDTCKKRVYVDFSQLNPKYVFPPAKETNEGKVYDNDVTTI